MLPLPSCREPCRQQRHATFCPQNEGTAHQEHPSERSLQEGGAESKVPSAGSRALDGRTNRSGTPTTSYNVGTN